MTGEWRPKYELKEAENNKLLKLFMQKVATVYLRYPEDFKEIWLCTFNSDLRQR